MGLVCLMVVEGLACLVVGREQGCLEGERGWLGGCQEGVQPAFAAPAGQEREERVG
jgi:hypothetical protein